MSKSSVTQQEADAVVAAYRKARFAAFAAKVRVDIAQAEVAKVTAIYAEAKAGYDKAKADDKIAEAAVEEAFEAAANVYLGPQQEDES